MGMRFGCGRSIPEVTFPRRPLGWHGEGSRAALGCRCMKVRAGGGMWVRAALVLGLAVTGCGHAPAGTQGGEAGVVETEPPPPVRGDGTVRRLDSRAEVPLTGLRVEAKP